MSPTRRPGESHDQFRQRANAYQKRRYAERPDVRIDAAERQRNRTAQQKFHKAERLAWRKLREMEGESRRSDRELGQLLGAGLSIITLRDLQQPIYKIKRGGKTTLEKARDYEADLAADASRTEEAAEKPPDRRRKYPKPQ